MKSSKHTFRKEAQEIPRPKYGCSAPKWQYFELMSFVKTTLPTVRNMIGNLGSGTAMLSSESRVEVDDTGDVHRELHIVSDDYEM